MHNEDALYQYFLALLNNIALYFLILWALNISSTRFMKS